MALNNHSPSKPAPVERIAYFTREEARKFLETVPDGAVFRVALRNPVPFPGMLLPPKGVKDEADAAFHVSRNQAVAAARFFMRDETEKAGGRVPISEYRSFKGAPTYLVG